MGLTEKVTRNGRKAFLRVTDKYYIGHDLYNVIVYTRRVTKKGVVEFGNGRYFPNIESAVNYIMDLTEIGAIGPDIKKMVDDIRAAKDEIKAFIAAIK